MSAVAIQRSEKPSLQLWLWIKIVALFGLASALQTLVYVGPRKLGIDLFYMLWVFLLFFGPGVAAALLAFEILRRSRPLAGRVTGKQVVVVAALFVLSCYLGVFISFNVWGT